MSSKDLVELWFQKWETGEFMDLPISYDFCHTSPNGRISGKNVYLELVSSNKEKFLNHRFQIHDAIYDKEKACVRYTAIQEDFKREVTEWYRIKNGLIAEIIANYNI